MTWNEAQSLDETLLSLDAFFIQEPRQVEILAGGLTNRSWKIISSDGEPYVWRSVSHHSYQFGISRDRENQLLQSLKACHFAPNPIYLNNSGLLVEWLEGEVGGSALSAHEVLGTLARIHSLDIHNRPIPLFAYTPKVDGYWLKLSPKLKTAEYEALYHRWRELPNILPVEPTLCHFDLGDYNMVRTGEGIKVIDWEYAGVGDPRMDLAMTIELAGIDREQGVATYCELRNITEIDTWLLGVEQWRPRNQMMAMLWYLLGYQLWNDDFYLREAHSLKERLCENSGPIIK